MKLITIYVSSREYSFGSFYCCLKLTSSLSIVFDGFALMSASEHLSTFIPGCCASIFYNHGWLSSVFSTGISPNSCFTSGFVVATPPCTINIFFNIVVPWNEIPSYIKFLYLLLLSEMVSSIVLVMRNQWLFLHFPRLRLWERTTCAATSTRIPNVLNLHMWQLTFRILSVPLLSRATLNYQQTTTKSSTAFMPFFRYSDFAHMMVNISQNYCCVVTQMTW